MGRVTVILDGTRPDSGEQPPGPRGRIGFLLGALAAALAIGLVAGSAFESVDDRSTRPGTRPLGEQVEGLDATVLMVVRRDGRTYFGEWAPTRPSPTETRLPVADASFNADGTLLAGLGTDLPDLYVGNEDTITVVATDVTSVVWHERDPNRLAAVRVLGNETQLWLGEVNESVGFLFSSLTEVGHGLAVRAYGDWGIALDTPVPTAGVFFLQYLDLEGQQLAHRSGRIVGSWSGTDGGILVDTGEDRLETISPAEGADVEIPDGRPLRAVRWVDQGRRAAATVGAGEAVTAVVSVDGATVAEAAGPALGWSAEGRFVLTGRAGSLGFVDTVDGSVEAVEVNGTVMAAITVP